MKKIMILTLILGVSFLFVEFFPKKAEAIPAFARKYKTSCMTCHAPFPRLTALGEAFRLSGFKMPTGDDAYIKDPPVSMGAESYKMGFPQAVWPSDIPGMPPIGIRIEFDTVYDQGREEPKLSFDGIEAEIMAAGSLGDNMSAFVEIEFEEAEHELEVEKEETGAGGEAVVTDVDAEFESGVGFAAWLMWEDILGGSIGDNYLNLRAGSIGMQDIALPNMRDHNRFTKQHYLYVDQLQLHGHGSSALGFELNGFGKWWRYNLGVLNGDGSTTQKDYYGALSFKISGLGYDGSGGTLGEGGLATPPSGYWRDDSILFGVFAMRTHIGADDEEFDRYGADIRANYKDLSVAAGYIKGANIRGHAGGAHGHGTTVVDKDIITGEVEYFAFPWLVPFVRYEILSVDGSDNRDQTRIALGAAILVRANVKLNLEGLFYTKNDPAEKRQNVGMDEDDRIFFRIDYAF